MTAEEIGVKFHALGDGVIGKGKCDRLAAAILNMENVSPRELVGMTVR
jgi:hypothetical protein